MGELLVPSLGNISQLAAESAANYSRMLTYIMLLVAALVTKNGMDGVIACTKISGL
jgi:hypothetical protein